MSTVNSRDMRHDSKYKGRVSSQLTGKILRQYVITIIVVTFAMALAVLFLRELCYDKTWYGTEFFYGILSFVSMNLIGTFALCAMVSWTVITIIFLRKPLGYLDEVIEASKSLAHPSSEPITLSPDMVETQGELNLVRERALADAKAAKDAEQRKNDLVVYLAHDLKTPLTSVIGYLTLLNDEKNLSEEVRQRYINIALNKAERLEELTNEFFDITRFNLSHIELEYETINITRLLEQIVFEFEPIFKEKNLTCSINAPSDIMVKCDPDKIQRVFDNLLRNAANYSYEDSKIRIRVILYDRDVEIVFINKGRTISKEKLDRIFEQFFRLDPSRGSQSGGSGLGLAIAKEIVNLHGGEIMAESGNEEIIFNVRLPLD